jgi:hypothetical protein
MKRISFMNFAVSARLVAAILAVLFLAACASNDEPKKAPAQSGFHPAWINM